MLFRSTEFERLNRELGQTIVMVTHDAVVAERAPRQIVVRDGLIASDRNSSQLSALSFQPSAIA